MADPRSAPCSTSVTAPRGGFAASPGRWRRVCGERRRGSTTMSAITLWHGPSVLPFSRGPGWRAPSSDRRRCRVPGGGPRNSTCPRRTEVEPHPAVGWRKAARRNRRRCRRAPVGTGRTERAPFQGRYGPAACAFDRRDRRGRRGLDRRTGERYLSVPDLFPDGDITTVS